MEVVLGSGNVFQAGQLVDGTCVRQSFVPGGPVLLSVSALMTCRSRADEGYVYMDVLEAGSRKVLGTSTVPAHELEDEGWCRFETEAFLTPGAKYELMLRTLNCRAGLGPLFYCGDCSAGGYVFLGSKLLRGAELSCRMEYGKEGR